MNIRFRGEWALINYFFSDGTVCLVCGYMQFHFLGEIVFLSFLQFLYFLFVSLRRFWFYLFLFLFVKFVCCWFSLQIFLCFVLPSLFLFVLFCSVLFAKWKWKYTKENWTAIEFFVLKMASYDAINKDRMVKLLNATSWMLHLINAIWLMLIVNDNSALLLYWRWLKDFPWFSRRDVYKANEQDVDNCTCRYRKCVRQKDYLIYQICS